jgi:hypothetical protein
MRATSHTSWLSLLISFSNTCDLAPIQNICKMRSQLFIILSLALVSSAKEKYQKNNGEIELLDKSEVHDSHKPEDGNPIVGRMLTRDLFARQYCSNPGENVICGVGCCPNSESCCESLSCGDPTQRICCQGGHQCPIGGDCCSDGNCVCWGAQLVITLDRLTFDLVLCWYLLREET